MSLPRYSKYKASDIEWARQVPAEWFVSRADALIQTSRDTIGPDQLRGLEVFHYSIPVVQETGDGRPEDGATIDSAKIVIREPQVLVSKLNPRKGTVCIATPKERLTVGSTEFVPLIPRGLRLRFVYYLVQSEGYKQRLESLVESATRSHQRAAPKDVVAFRWAFPGFEEQDAIVTFLDIETAKIDALIAEQERLIELLKEKRQAVISQAVTKGLREDVPMKVSGIDWVGNVPAHWKVLQLKQLTDPNRPIMYGIVLPGPDVGDGIPVLKGGNVKPNRMKLSEMARTTPEIEAPYARARLKAGDIVYAIRGTIGECELVPPDLEGSNITQDVARVAANLGVDASWLRWALLSSQIREELASRSLGSAVRGVNICDLQDVRVPTPPSKEQLEIATRIELRTRGLDRLATEAERGIAVLQERRAALISAAVTGQIDVRGLAEQKAA